MTFKKWHVAIVVGAAVFTALLVALNWDYDADAIERARKRPLPDDQVGAIATYAAMIQRDYVVASAGSSLRTVTLSAEDREGRRVNALLEPWSFCYPPTSQVFVVPRTFATDYSSIPGWAAWMLNPRGWDNEGAVIHDWLYALGQPGKREEADLILRYGLRTKGVPAWQRNLMFLAVRIGGGAPYGAPNEWQFRDPDSEAPADPPYAQEDWEWTREAHRSIPCDCVKEHAAYLRDMEALRTESRETEVELGCDGDSPCMLIPKGMDPLLQCMADHVGASRIFPWRGFAPGPDVPEEPPEPEPHLVVPPSP